MINLCLICSIILQLAVICRCGYKLIVAKTSINISLAECEDKARKIVVWVFHDNDVTRSGVMSAFLAQQQLVHYHLLTRAVAH